MEPKHHGHVRVGKDLKSLEIMLIPQSVKSLLPAPTLFCSETLPDFTTTSPKAFGSPQIFLPNAGEQTPNFIFLL